MPEFVYFPRCTAVPRLADYFFHPPPAACSTPFGTTQSFERGKADLDIGPHPDNQIRTEQFYGQRSIPNIVPFDDTNDLQILSSSTTKIKSL